MHNVCERMSNVFITFASVLSKVCTSDYEKHRLSTVDCPSAFIFKLDSEASSTTDENGEKRTLYIYFELNWPLLVPTYE